jgi:hypothetical protein
MRHADSQLPQNIEISDVTHRLANVPQQQIMNFLRQLQVLAQKGSHVTLASVVDAQNKHSTLRDSNNIDEISHLSSGRDVFVRVNLDPHFRPMNKWVIPQFHPYPRFLGAYLTIEHDVNNSMQHPKVFAGCKLLRCSPDRRHFNRQRTSTGEKSAGVIGIT